VENLNPFKMPSSTVKVIFALTALSPAFLLLYVLKIINNHDKLSFYINVKSFQQVAWEIGNFLENHYLAFLFLALVFIARYIIAVARKHFSIGRIDINAVKPGDTNLTAMLFSVIPIAVKIYSPSISEWILTGALFLLGVVFGLTMKASYHFNPTLKLLLGYSHYEIQTKEGITYLMISKTQIIDRKKITRYVKLADHMLLNVSDNN
jgi:hypothetical protein